MCLRSLILIKIGQKYLQLFRNLYKSPEKQKYEKGVYYMDEQTTRASWCGGAGGVLLNSAK